MTIGILSDTHDRIPALEAGVRTLLANGAGCLIHCGDIGGERAIDCLAGHDAAFVWGNTDWDRRGLDEYARSVGVRCLGTGGCVEIDGKRVCVTHGDEPATVRRYLSDPTTDYLLMGHTHQLRDERIDNVRVINPGALHRAAVKTVVLLDVPRDKVIVLEVPNV
jgi:putative phosphoesterase